jgi:hypothetical protein
MLKLNICVISAYVEKMWEYTIAFAREKEPNFDRLVKKLHEKLGDTTNVTNHGVYGSFSRFLTRNAKNPTDSYLKKRVRTCKTNRGLNSSNSSLFHFTVHQHPPFSFGPVR